MSKRLERMTAAIAAERAKGEPIAVDDPLGATCLRDVIRVLAAELDDLERRTVGALTAFGTLIPVWEWHEDPDRPGVMVGDKVRLTFLNEKDDA